MANLYCLPGMGTDHRIYDRLAPLLQSQSINFLDYIQPLHRREPIEEYVQRLSGAISLNEEPLVLMGMSLGGLLAVELSKIVPYQKLFLISSLKKASAAPWYFRPLRTVPAQRIVPAWFSKMSMGWLSQTTGITSKEGADYLRKMIRDRTADHLAWGRNTAINWLNEEVPQNCVHLHGDKDHVFPHKKSEADYTIKGGTHCMIFDRAEELALIINEELKKL